MNEELRVDGERLRRDIEELAAIGRDDAGGGIYRMALGDAEMEARRWFEGKCRAAGLAVHVDPATNVHGRLGWDGERPSVMVGSHLDSVPGGGHLDGALGVVAGLECLRRVREAGVELRSPLEVVAFADEEGRFGGMLGSKAIAGRLTAEMVEEACDADGLALTSALADRGFDAGRVLAARRRPESLRAFIELHIEQGPVLERAGVPIGVVEAIVGLFRWTVRLTGQANHAGTTPMDHRRDAFVGAAELGHRLPELVDAHGGPRAVATIGHLALEPGAPNVVPGAAVFTLEARDTDAAALARLSGVIRETLTDIAARRDLGLEIEVVSELAPVACHPEVRETVAAAARVVGAPTLSMPTAPRTTRRCWPASRGRGWSSCPAAAASATTRTRPRRGPRSSWGPT